MEPDIYGEYLVQNLYYDTEQWDKIRESVDKPPYKEKLRLRRYGELNYDGDLFLELKKKFKGIVYKRRIAYPAAILSTGSVDGAVMADDAQIAREIAFYMKANAVSAKIYISYARKAYAGIDDGELRLTIDSDIRFRLDNLHFYRPGDGYAVLPRNKLLMEIKSLGGMPLWLARALSETEIYPTAFSKYGVCYTGFILSNTGLEGLGTERMRANISA
jgi:hypothetical protein